jgi:hypothetical protein
MGAIGTNARFVGSAVVGGGMMARKNRRSTTDRRFGCINLWTA